jgi:hypothetical protein
MQDDSMQSTQLLLIKQLALIGSGMFFIYFIFILPGTNINPENLTQWNWVNQSLIELKRTIKDCILNFIGNSGNPGNPGNSDNSNVNSIELDTYFPKSTYRDVGVSPISPSVSSDGTITPTISNSNIPCLSNYVETSTQTNLNLVEASTQTTLRGLGVSRMVAAVNTVVPNLSQPSQDSLSQAINSVITNITD